MLLVNVGIDSMIELPHHGRQFQHVPTTYVHQIRDFNLLTLFFHKLLNYIYCFSEMSMVKKNIVSCSLVYIWTTIIDCKF